MMGVMLPETCWDRSLIINIGLVASCWFISLHPLFDALLFEVRGEAEETILIRKTESALCEVQVRLKK